MIGHSLSITGHPCRLVRSSSPSYWPIEQDSTSSLLGTSWVGVLLGFPFGDSTGRPLGYLLGLQLGLFSCGNRTTCTSASQGIHLGPLLGHPFLCRRFFHISIVLVITLNGSFPIGIPHTDTCAIASAITVDAAGLTISVPACC